MTGGLAWMPYCPDHKKVELLTFVERVKALALNADVTSIGCSLSGGLPGVVSFLECYGRLFNDSISLGVADRLRQQVLEFRSESNRYSYFGGRSGALSLFELSTHQDDLQRHFENEDETITRFVRDNPAHSLEWINGLAGVGNYALCRRSPNFQLAELISNAILAGLKVPNNNVPFDLGIAHGIPGVVLYLSDFSLLSGNKSVLALIYELVCLQEKFRNRNTASIYPYISDQTINSRLGWCYGDLSVAISMLRAADALEIPEIAASATDLIEHSAGRSRLSAQVSDGALCHGSLGLAHLFHRCHLWCGSDAARLAAVRWLSYFIDEQSLALSRNFQGMGLLEGLAGGAQAALSSLCDEPPHWDNVLIGRAV